RRKRASACSRASRRRGASYSQRLINALRNLACVSRSEEDRVQLRTLRARNGSKMCSRVDYHQVLDCPLQIGGHFGGDGAEAAGGGPRLQVNRLAEDHAGPALALGTRQFLGFDVLLKLLDGLGHALDGGLRRQVVSWIAEELQHQIQVVESIGELALRLHRG